MEAFKFSLYFGFILLGKIVMIRTQFEGIPPDVLQSVETCTKERGIDFEATLMESDACVETMKLISVLKESLVTLGSLDKKYGTKYITDQFCKLKDPLTKCATEMKQKLDVCLDEKMKQIFDNLLLVSEASWNFACKDGGKRLAALLSNSRDVQCFKVEMQMCIKELDSKETSLTYLEHFDEEHCKYETSAHFCLLDRLQRHCSREVSDFMGGHLHEIAQAHACKDYIVSTGNNLKSNTKNSLKSDNEESLKSNIGNSLSSNVLFLAFALAVLGLVFFKEQ